MYIDFKVTTWERIEVDKEDEIAVMQALKDGTIISSSDMLNITGDVCYYPVEGVDDYMTPEENGGASTIEVLNDKGETIWENGNYDKEIIKWL